MLRSRYIRRKENLWVADDQIETLGFAGFSPSQSKYISYGHDDGEGQQCPGLTGRPRPNDHGTFTRIKHHNELHWKIGTLSQTGWNRYAKYHFQIRKLVTCFRLCKSSLMGLSILAQSLVSGRLWLGQARSQSNTVRERRKDFSEIKGFKFLRHDRNDPTLRGFFAGSAIQNGQKCIRPMSLESFDLGNFVNLIRWGQWEFLPMVNKTQLLLQGMTVAALRRDITGVWKATPEFSMQALPQLLNNSPGK